MPSSRRSRPASSRCGPTPHLGVARDHLAPGMRAVYHRSYAIYYEATDAEIVVLRVIHGSRDIAALFGNEC